VVYSGDVYIANYNGGLNPPIGAVPGVSSLWTLFADAGGSGGGITGLTSSDSSIDITNPSGPTSDLKIIGLDPLNILPNTVTSTKFGYLTNVTSDIQTQINNIISGYVNFECLAIATANKTIATPGATNWDGITPSNGDIVFLLPAASGGSQTTASEGGLYTYNGAATPLTRLSTMSTWAEVVGSRIYVNAGGSTFGNTAWINTNNPTGTIDVTAITYQQQQNSYAAGTNMVLIGNIFSTSLTPGFTSETLSANTNFLVTGTTNTMTWTMATLTGSHIFTLPNANSNPVQPRTLTAGSAVQFIDSNGLQNLMVVIDQVLTSFTATPGTVSNTDTVVQAIGKIAGNAASAITSITGLQGIAIDNTTPTAPIVLIHKQGATINSSGQIAVDTNYVAVGTTVLTITLPSSSAVLAAWGAFAEITITNLNIAISSIVPDTGDTINESASAISITGAYATKVFYIDPVHGWLIK
jgi:hypothetical protein